MNNTKNNNQFYNAVNNTFHNTPVNNNNNSSNSGSIGIPVFNQSNSGRVLNTNFNAPPRLPMPKPVCPTRGGLRSQLFRTCFYKYLAQAVKPYFDEAAAAAGKTNRMNAACTMENSKLAPHQIVTYELAKLMASVPVEDLGYHRGLLMWANAGSGKTIASLAVAMAFWPTPIRIYMTSTGDNAEKNRNAFIAQAPKFFPTEYMAIVDDFKERKPATAGLSDTEVFTMALKERVQVLSLVKARNRLAAKKGEFKSKALTNVPPLEEGAGSVLIIDEAQNLQIKDKKDKHGDAIKLGCALRKMSPERMKKIRVFALTATPGNSIKEWLKILSLVRRADQPHPFASDADVRGVCTSLPNSGRSGSGSGSGGRDEASQLHALIRRAMTNDAGALSTLVNYVNDKFYGLLTYADIRGDVSRHACVEEEFETHPLEKMYLLLMLQEHARLRRDPAKLKVGELAYDPSVPSQYELHMRSLGNSLPQSVWQRLPQPKQQYLLKNNRIVKGQLISLKFAKLAQFINKNPGKHFVYTADPKNAHLLAYCLRKWFRMVDITEAAEPINVGAKVSNNGKSIVNLPPGPNNMMILDPQKTKQKKRLQDIFSHKDNTFGKYVRIVIATGLYYEGVDLAGLRYVHLCEPMPNALMETQAVGRGVRQCGHRFLPADQRKVTIVRWFSTMPMSPQTRKPIRWEDLLPLVGKINGMKKDPRKIKAEFDKLEKMGSKSFDELVYERTRADPEFLVMYNFENIMKSLSVDCPILGSKFNPGGSCTKAIMTSKIVIPAGRKCSSS